jgi:ubiquinone/menaquinone biosynthesis C-methylase UbiE
VTRECGDAPNSAAAVWNQGASSYDALRRIDPVYSSCLHQVASGVPARVSLCLDAGCGTGLSTVALSPRCDLVIAVDYSIESLRILDGRGFANVVPVQADLKLLPFRDSAFDACVCANTLQHLNPRGAQQRAVAELRRVTKESGPLRLSVHHYSRDKRRAGWTKEGRPGQAGIDYIFRFSRDDLLAIMPRSTIRGIGYYGALRVPYLGSRLQNVLACLLGGLAGRLGHGHMLIAVAKNRKRDVAIM